MHRSVIHGGGSMAVVTVRMDEELVRRVEELAKLQGVTRSALIKQSLREAIERRSASHVREAVLTLRQGRDRKSVV